MVREAYHSLRRPRTATSEARSGARQSNVGMASARSVLHVTITLCDTTYLPFIFLMCGTLCAPIFTPFTYRA